MRWLLQGLQRLCAATVRGSRAGTLIVQPLPGIGDMIWHLGHVHSIAMAEGAPVSIITKPRSRARELFAADGAVKEVLWLERNPGRHDGVLGFFRLVCLLRRRRYAKAWLLHGSSRYAWTLLLAGIPLTIGYGRGLQRSLLSSPMALPPGATHGHPMRLADLLLQAHGIPRSEAAPRVVIDGEALRRIDEEHGHREQPWIAFGIGSSEPYKQWGTNRYSRLAERLLGDSAGSLFLIGGPAEEAMARAIVVALPALADRIVTVTQRPLNESIALLSRCRLCVSNDTGVFNAAAAAGIRVLVLIVSGWEPPWKDNVVCMRPPAGCDDIATIEPEAVAGQAAHLLHARDHRGDGRQ
ncbi:MAG: glycosyltransferase family 9 protein [Gammaproteobacteria bacterium]